MFAELTWPRIVLIGAVVAFVAMMVTNSIRLEIHNTNVQQQLMDGTTCILGSIQGLEGIDRPDPTRVEAACERYIKAEE